MGDLVVVDLGTKTGSALDAYRKQATARGLPTAAPHQCLGVDLTEKYREAVESRGYAFRAGNVLDDRVELPRAEVYLAFHFLEHLPSVADAQRVLLRMFAAARTAVWLRLPSFEDDPLTGEGALRKHGLRFTWTHWRGHPAPVLVEHVRQAVAEHERRTGTSLIVQHAPRCPITTSMDSRVVPIDAPIDTVEHSAELGPKPSVSFAPAVIGEHEMLVRMAAETPPSAPRN